MDHTKPDEDVCVCACVFTARETTERNAKLLYADRQRRPRSCGTEPTADDNGDMVRCLRLIDCRLYATSVVAGRHPIVHTGRDVRSKAIRHLSPAVSIVSYRSAGPDPAPRRLQQLNLLLASSSTGSGGIVPAHLHRMARRRDRQRRRRY